MSNLPMNALRVFGMVCETGGIRAAARALSITHSSVSRHVKELEGWLGTRLFEPGSRVLTPQGRLLGEAVLESLSKLDDATAAIREQRHANSVVISTTASVAVRWLLPQLEDLRQAHPGIEISVLTEQALIEPGAIRADLAIRMGRGPWSGVDCQPLMDDALYPVVHPESLAKLGRRKPDTLFRRYPLLHDRDPQAAWSIWFDAFPQDAVDLRRGSRYSSSDLVLRAASRGLGIALARDRLVADEIAVGALRRPFGNAQVHVPDAYWVVTPIRDAPREAVHLVIEWLHRRASPNDVAPRRLEANPRRN
jgi:LysR family glycine cleavage system transcriptional activator